MQAFVPTGENAIPKPGGMANKRRKHLAGVYAPTIAAYGPDGQVDIAGTKRYVRFLLEQNVHGLAPLGSAGEPMALTLEERKRILEAIVEETSGKVPIFAGIVEYGTSFTIELGLHAKSLGCDGIMLMPPYLIRPPKRDVLDHFRRIRDRVGLPIMVYNVPALNGIEITPAELCKLAEEEVIHAVKWSHGEVSRIQDTRLLCGPDFPIFAGVDLIAFGALALGADGWIGGLPMMVPRHCVRLFELLTCQRELAQAQSLWYRLLPLIQIEYRALGAADNDPHWLAVCREAALLRGLPVGDSRLPMSSLEPAVREELKAALVKLGEL